MVAESFKYLRCSEIPVDEEQLSGVWVWSEYKCTLDDSRHSLLRHQSFIRVAALYVPAYALLEMTAQETNILSSVPAVLRSLSFILSSAMLGKDWRSYPELLQKGGGRFEEEGCPRV